MERKRTGCNKPNVIYVKNFALVLNRNRGAPEFRPSDTSNTNKSKTDMNKTDISGISENPHLYGTFHNVVLKDLEIKELKRRFPYDWKDWIEKISAYMKSTGKYYHNHYATICIWAVKEQKHITAKNYDVKELSAMVQQVNETEVSTEDCLSDHVHHYDSKEAVMENAEKRVSRFEKEKAETKAAKKSIHDRLGGKKQQSTMKKAEKAVDKVVKKDKGQEL